MPTINYTPIDYGAWNFDGQGINILDRLSTIEREIWKKGLPFQDKRNDTGHAEVATYFALILTERTGRNRCVTVPAIITHDIGYRVDPEKFREAFISKPDKEAQLRIRLEHQIRGGILAYNILRDSGLSSDCIAEILRINLDHDTRFYETTPDGEIVQDADVLWRATKPCIDAYLSGKPVEEVRRLSEDNIFPLLNLPLSKEIARIELENSMRFFK
ncbi:MAG: hypothetical protein Q7S06_03875 [Nanoarchaeota archaeon]|nr:hypothetical protein [Nanoarchaeota archaeon]